MTRIPPRPPCPDAARHTPHPTGYIGHSCWAEQMLQTHVQRVCSGCGGWEIWIPKDPANQYSPAIADQPCANCSNWIAEGQPMRTNGDCGWLCTRCGTGPNVIALPAAKDTP